jgi:endonuclease YncB( thermonuclease family)
MERGPGPAVVRAPGCRFERTGTGLVNAVVDGRSFVLDNGREMRLHGIETPFMPTAGESGARADADRGASRAAVGALAALVLGQTIELDEEGLDRYGRTRVWARLAGAPASVAHDLLAQGVVRVAAEVGPRPCAMELWGRERAARQAKLGLWGEAYYAVRRADDLAGLAAEQGQFVLVEGRVTSVRESGGWIYVNLARRWSQTLTVALAKRSERAIVAAGLEPRQLERRQIRVRGFVEERNGPRIEVTRAEQIEIAEGN